MKRLLLSSAALLIAVCPLMATDWSVQAKKLAESVVYIENASGSCSGSAINTAKGFILTAAHCDGEKLYADQTPAKVVSKDVKADLMILEIKDLERPALKLALKNPVVGQEAATYGYGYGLERPLFRVHHISEAEAQIPELPYKYVTVDTSFLPGQSGGPIIDLNGNIVGIVQRGNEAVGLGVGAEIIKSKVGKFFEGAK